MHSLSFDLWFWQQFLLSQVVARLSIASDEELENGWLNIGTPVIHLSNTKENAFGPFLATIDSLFSACHLFIHLFFFHMKGVLHMKGGGDWLLIHCTVPVSLPLLSPALSCASCPGKAPDYCRKSGPAKPQRHNPLLKMI